MNGDAASVSAYQRGNRHFVAKQYPEAIEAFAAHAEEHPADAADCLERIAACYVRTNVVSAPRPIAGTPLSLVSAGNTELAEHYFRRALEINPKHLAALRGLADLPCISKDEGAGLLERAMALQPNYLSLCDLGDYYRSKKNWGRAEELYRQAHESNPRDKGAYDKLADLFVRSGRKAEAAEWRAKWKAMDAQRGRRKS